MEETTLETGDISTTALPVPSTDPATDTTGSSAPATTEDAAPPDFSVAEGAETYLDGLLAGEGDKPATEEKEPGWYRREIERTQQKLEPYKQLDELRRDPNADPAACLTAIQQVIPQETWTGVQTHLFWSLLSNPNNRALLYSDPDFIAGYHQHHQLPALDQMQEGYQPEGEYAAPAPPSPQAANPAQDRYEQELTRIREAEWTREVSAARVGVDTQFTSTANEVWQRAGLAVKPNDSPETITRKQQLREQFTQRIEPAFHSDQARAKRYQQVMAWHGKRGGKAQAEALTAELLPDVRRVAGQLAKAALGELKDWAELQRLRAKERGDVRPEATGGASPPNPNGQQPAKTMEEATTRAQRRYEQLMGASPS